MRGFYERRVFPWLNDLLAREPALQALRREALAGARGRVVEIGLGTGANLSQYPATVVSVTGVEPNPGMTDRVVRPAGRLGQAVRLVHGRAEALPFREASFEAAVSTLTLCSVDSPEAALAELHRVLVPGGTLHLLEHGLADDTRVARWQRRLNGLERVVACGCSLDRPMAALVESHGFRFESVRRFFVPRVPRTHGWVTVGRAIRLEA